MAVTPYGWFTSTAPATFLLLFLVVSLNHFYFASSYAYLQQSRSTCDNAVPKIRWGTHHTTVRFSSLSSSSSSSLRTTTTAFEEKYNDKEDTITDSNNNNWKKKNLNNNNNNNKKSLPFDPHHIDPHHIDPAGPSQDLLQLNINESYTYTYPREEDDSNGEEEEEDDDDDDDDDGGEEQADRFFNVLRLSSSPHIFVFENLLSSEECNSLIIQSSESSINSSSNRRSDSSNEDNVLLPVEMKEAKITEGNKDVRSNCEVGWIPNQTIDSDGSTDGTTPATNRSNNQSLPLKLGRIVGNILMSDEAKRNGWCEPLQLVHYNAQGGKFDLHYDGLYRTITIIYYLNGVGNTWFPFASTTGSTAGSGSSIDNDEEEEIESSLMDKNNNKRILPPSNRDEAVQLVNDACLKPGKHGILVAGVNSKIWNDEEEYNEENIVRINKGDAIAFYNYKSSSSSSNNVIKRDWRSIHAGLPTTLEEGDKWIANHWIHHLPFQKDWEQMEKV